LAPGWPFVAGESGGRSEDMDVSPGDIPGSSDRDFDEEVDDVDVECSCALTRP